MILCEESAVDNFCLAVALKAKDNDKSYICGMIVSSPIIDLTNSLDNLVYPIDSFIVRSGFLNPLNKHYVGISKPNNKYI